MNNNMEEDDDWRDFWIAIIGLCVIYIAAGTGLYLLSLMEII